MALPSCMATSAVIGYTLAIPLTPSVPNNFLIIISLSVLLKYYLCLEAAFPTVTFTLTVSGSTLFKPVPFRWTAMAAVVSFLMPLISIGTVYISSISFNRACTPNIFTVSGLTEIPFILIPRAGLPVSFTFTRIALLIICGSIWISKDAGFIFITSTPFGTFTSRRLIIKLLMPSFAVDRSRSAVNWTGERFARIFFEPRTLTSISCNGSPAIMKTFRSKDIKIHVSEGFYKGDDGDEELHNAMANT